MYNDLLFPILPKEGKAPIPKEKMRIKSISKEAHLRQLSDEEKAMTTDEREIHEIYKKNQQGQQQKKQAKPKPESSDEEHEEKDSAKKQNAKTDTDEDGWTKDGHLDIYV